MKPLQKANNIIEKLMDIDLNPLEEHGKFLNNDEARIVALIAVDELIEEAIELDRLKFWTQVKREIWQRRRKK